MVVETPAQTQSREEREAESKEHERLDLKAQEKAADAADAQVLPNRVGTVLTVVGTLVLFLTLRLTQQSLNLSRRTSVAELRAYLGVYSYRAEHRKDGTVDLSFVVQNFGQTPAVRLRSGWTLMTSPDGPLPEGFEFSTNPDTLQRTGQLTPNNEFNFGPGTLSQERVLALIAKKRSCFIFGWVDYDDTLGGPRHRLEFATEVEAHPKADGTGHIFRFAATERHNNMDGDCERQPDPW